MCRASWVCRASGVCWLMFLLWQLQELHDKSNAAKLTCSGIKWHYLGRVARKKMKVLLGKLL